MAQVSEVPSSSDCMLWGAKGEGWQRAESGDGYLRLRWIWRGLHDFPGLRSEGFDRIPGRKVARMQHIPLVAGPRVLMLRLHVAPGRLDDEVYVPRFPPAERPEADVYLIGLKEL